MALAQNNHAATRWHNRVPPHAAPSPSTLREFPSLHRERQSEMVVAYSSLLLFTVRLKYRSTPYNVALARGVRLSVSCGGILMLVAHGRQEYVVLPAMAEHVLKICPTATASWYDDLGHAPFLEDPAPFNRELAELVQQIRA